MSLSKFLKSVRSNWPEIAFWICMACAIINLVLMFIQKQVGDRVAMTNSLLNMAFCALGMVLNYFRLQKPKVK